MSVKTPEHYQEKTIFGRKKGRPLSKTRAAALEKLLPVLQIDKTLLKQDGSYRPPVSNTDQKVVLEIGFGNGERLAKHIAHEPEAFFLGAEPFINGMAAFLQTFYRPAGKPPENLRVLMNDGMILAKSLQEQTIDEIYILNPDPWHKKRHHKRRIVNRDNLDVLARILKPGGRLVLSTDVLLLAEWMMVHTFCHPAFSWEAEGANDWKKPPEGWIPTRYETKRARGGTKMHYLFFKRK